jgi:hypothetical protein
LRVLFLFCVVQMYFLGAHLDGVHVPSLVLGAACLGLIRLWPKEWAKVAPPQVGRCLQAQLHCCTQTALFSCGSPQIHCSHMLCG